MNPEPPPVPDAPFATPVASQRQFPCKQCGANLVFAPGTTHLKCPYCGAENDIPADPGAVVAEQDFRATLAGLAGQKDTVDAMFVKCTACGAEAHFPPGVVADKCPFCGHPIVATASSKRLIRPQSLLPFHITKEQAADSFRKWVSSRWFAPNALKREAARSKITGAYIPAWTYDSDTISDYTGQRGDDYWDTETYTTTENGQTVTRTRQVRRTRWRYASGRVFNRFDDVLVLASNSLPRKYAAALEPWDLKNLVPYRDEYLSGFVAESYQVDLAQGFDVARGIMDGHIRQSICRDIGGDHQRIDRVNTQYREITFKHTLLPIWISAYEFLGRTFRFLVNARTGEVQGERPYSGWKIFLLVLVLLVGVLVVVLLANR
jgi:predicted RNA-binding Zn-ribbon protein involved in translation (DUF1610 family)